MSPRYLPVAVLRAAQYLLLNTIKYLLYLVDILIYTLHFSGILNDL
jgi:hypothetical protein